MVMAKDHGVTASSPARRGARSSGHERFSAPRSGGETVEEVKTAAVRRKGGWVRKVLSLLIPPKGQRNRPTTSGWLLILIAIGIGVAAYNTASNILFLVLAFVFALLIVNGVLSVLNFRKIDWELRLPAECRAGDALAGTLVVQNRKKVFSTRAVWFVVRVGRGDRQRVYLRERIGPGERRLLPLAVDLPRRGRETIRVEGPESTYPFGFLRKQTGSLVEREFIVWPASDQRTPRPPEPRRTVRSGGMRQKIGSGTDLVQLRDYRKGDPLRSIHWKATARTGQLMVRQLADDGTGALGLRIDGSETLWPSPDLFERFLSRVSAVAETLFRQDRLMGYKLNEGEFKPVRHLSDLKALNDRLALLEPSEGRMSATLPAGSWIRFEPTSDGGIHMEEVR